MESASHPQKTTVAPLTRKEFYELAEFCQQYAHELARHDQHRVNLKHCHQFNQWLSQVKSYDLLAPSLRNLKPARPIARWQVMVLGVVIGLILLFMLPARADQFMRSFITYAYFFGLIILFFVPERIYGTTVELIEAKVLRVVEEMEKLLLADKLDFSEAAYFQAKENLQAAREELRQQIDLSSRARRGSMFG